MALRPVYPAALLLWPLLAALIVWLWRRRGAVRSGSSWLILALRLTLITLLTLALANPGGQAAANAQRLVVLVDRSASLDEAALAEVQRELANRFSSPEVLVVQFAEGQQWVANLAEDWPAAPGQDYTSDLESALNFAGQLLTGGSGSILLISDGRQTSGDALRAARALREADSRVRVDVLPLSAATHTPDVAVESIRLPPAIWAGEDIFVTVNLYSAPGPLREAGAGRPARTFA
jgi:hypothetical protein